MSENLEFRISSGLKDIIGRDLITDDFIAVFELVKNSYDAFAKNVVVTIDNDKITIADDGKGMSLTDLKKKWLFVAYSAKKDDTEDSRNDSYRDVIQERRHYAGAKGIGRFSSDRLGGKLAIITKKEDSNLVEKIKIDWSKFEKDQNQEFEKIKVLHETLLSEMVSLPNESTKGTILEITNLHTFWDRKRLQELKHSLEKLINPFSETNDFNIEIICHNEKEKDEFEELERNKVNGKVKNSILEILDIKTTQISVRINKEEIETKIIDRGYPIYHIKEKNKDLTFLDNAKIDLYFLNTSAKNNFTRKMGIQVVNFGSVFLFKNGFRVQPYGEFGDDSWGLDQRKTQGYNRFLGTRDLFGRVDITTNNTYQFKEVTSRDGGLVETEGYYQLMKAFREKGLMRLERYVVGVLWGEGFKRKNYFGDDEGAQEFRQELIEKDRISDDISIASTNLGSKLDFIQIIKGLATDDEIEIINYNKDFVSLVNENINEHQIKFVSDLEKIAENTEDKELKKQILRTEEQYQELKRAKEEAEEKKRLAENARIEAEKRQKEAEEKKRLAENARIEAEKRQKEAEERKQLAEIETLKKEKQRVEAENAKLIAEKIAIDEKKKREIAESVAERRKEQLILHKSAKTVEYKDLRDSNHIIGVYSDDISKKILLLKRKLDKGKSIEKKELISFIQGISLANEKIATLTRFTTKSNFLKASLETEQDIVSYIINYIKKTYQVLYRIDIDIINNNVSYIKKFQPIELSLVIDNIISNSRKKRASKVIFEFNIVNNRLQISIKDIGAPLSDKIQDWNLIFEEGITTTKGSGLGLNHVKRIVKEDLKGKIIYNPNYTKGFELIITI